VAVSSEVQRLTIVAVFFSFIALATWGVDEIFKSFIDFNWIKA
jgi:hypothetical protein